MVTVVGTWRRIRRGAAALGFAALALALLPIPDAFPQIYPSRPVRVIIPYPPGGGADTVGRILYTKLSDKLGQQFVIDNRPGGGGTIAAGLVARAPADGYTLLHDATAFSVNPSLFKQLPFDPQKDFQPIFLAVVVPNLLVVHPSVPQKTVPEIIAFAKTQPNGLDWASSGNGTVQHMALELFRQTAGVNLVHVPYRGGGPALTDLAGGQIKYFFSNATASTGHVKAGTIRAIAHTGTGRLKAFPELPPVADTLPGFEAYEWNGLFAPAGTPAEVVQKLNAELNAVIKDPAIAERLSGLNAETRENTPDQFRAFVANEVAKWAKVVREGNIKIE
jgi:tripartite-type tricarboxylate transporter receptor subunit TctC